MRVIVFAGAGDEAFSAGKDMSEFARRRNDANSNAEFRKFTRRVRQKMASLGKPSIACILGYCVGGCLGLFSRRTFESRA